MAKVTICHRNVEETFAIRPGLGFQALCAHHSTAIEFDCRKADCGICIIRVVAGIVNLSSPTVAERDFLKAMRADPDERFACQTRIFGDVRVIVDSL